MNDALGMSSRERIGKRESDLEERWHVEPAAGQAVVQRFTIEQFHDEERHG